MTAQNGMIAGQIGTANRTWPQIAAPSLFSRLLPWLGATISFALLAVVLSEFRSTDFARLLAEIPPFGAFWFVFAAYYFVTPISEWVIFRRLWNLPFSGIGALILKYVSNEILLGYLGEGQFYAWARNRTQMTAAPFGAIKDVAILSALAGNFLTLVMLVAAWPLIWSGALGADTRTIFISLSVVLATSMLIVLFRRKIFSLPRGKLEFIGLAHVMRILAFIAISALIWHLLIPSVAWGMWLVLATLRMLVSRLPLLPNKEILFAGLATFLVGHNSDIASVMTMIAGLMLVTHLVMGGLFAGLNLAQMGKRK